MYIVFGSGDEECSLKMVVRREKEKALEHSVTQYALDSGPHERYLDLEAAVDSEGEIGEDDEEELERQESFIFDGVEDDQPHQLHQGFRDHDREAEEEEMGAAYDALLDRVLGNSRNDPVVYNHTCWQPEDALKPALWAIELLRHPTIEDSPLYRVACRVGTEEKIVMNLLHAASPIHELRSAFTPGHIRGYVYLECSMNSHLVQLLSNISGITRTREGLRYQIIELADRPKLLTLPKNKLSVYAAGQWVQIQKGLYKGDVGLVAQTCFWGVFLLVVPRLSYGTAQDGMGKGKRKATAIRNPPKLFDREEFEKANSAKIRTLGEHIIIGPQEFVHGLLFEAFEYSALAAPVFQMPWSLSAMFAFALENHDDVRLDLKRRPRPEEWVFFEDEKVLVQSSGKRGIIRSLELTHAEVEYKDEGTHIVYWYDIQKDIHVGDFVTLLNGPQQGYQGWVTELTGDAAKVQDKIQTTDDPNSREPALEMQLNRLRITDTPFHHAQQATADNIKITNTPRHPWCGTEVLITKLGHARKGDPAMVTEVLDDSTGIRLQVKFMRYDPNNPFSKITLDCDDVVEASTQLSLLSFFGMRDPRHRTNPDLRQTNSGDTTGSATPMPTASSSTPAWDPSSRTPSAFDHWLLQLSPTRVQASNENQILQSSTLVLPPVPQHVLLNERLVGAQLSAIVDGGSYKKQLKDVVILRVDGRLGIFHPKHKKNYPLEPHWVAPKHPSPSYDHGLLMVIQGEHCGKYVRRIAHLDRSNGVVIVLAVVNHVPNTADTLTGETLYIAPEHLCKAKEPDNDKKLNKNVMTSVRKEFKS
ncbi:hypothetical protein BJ912DRAFT_924095 [Pholiota molesta]|nr:hypothetical protein BJ912DRAFT_924095 [Pholiota molesta]